MTDSLGQPVLSQRVSDAERDACLDLLSEHHIAGRLGIEDLDQRQRAALCAVTKEDLASLLSDLPVSRACAGSETPLLPPAGHRDRSPYWRPIAWGIPPTVMVSAAALMSNYRTDLLDREDAFLAALATGAAGFLSHWATSMVKQLTD